MGKKKQKKHHPLAFGYTEGFMHGNVVSYSKKIYTARRVKIVNSDGVTVFEGPVFGYDSDWNSLKGEYKDGIEVTGDEKSGLVETLKLPEHLANLAIDVRLTKAKPMACLYTSIADYCQSLLGIRFTDEDRRWHRNSSSRTAFASVESSSSRTTACAETSSSGNGCSGAIRLP